MIKRREITEEQGRGAIGGGEFGEDIRNSSRCVAVVMTQDWCPQWSTLESALEALQKEKKPDDFDIDVYELVYNLTSYSGEFMAFKEKVFGNSEIPYVRYFIDGKLAAESNWISKDGFLQKFNRG